MNVTVCKNTLVGSTGINGDVSYISPDKKVFLLADGASGAGESGKVLMGQICIDIVKKFDYVASKLNAKEYIDELFWKINNELIKISQQYRKLVYGTLNIAIFDKGILTVSTIGDSPAFYHNGGNSVRIAKCQKRYEWMIDSGYITREQYNGYIEQMHDMMWGCFDMFIPTVVLNNIIEQYKVKINDTFVFCSDGLGDWITKERIFHVLNEYKLDYGIDQLIYEAKENSLRKNLYFDDITVLAVRWTD